MLLGHNTNFRHRGVLFHVQTEDSGLANPHVITHLFHGGNILASEKRDYSDKLESDNLEPEVKALMELQHKAMLKRLKAGVHDAVIIQRMGPNFFKDEVPGDATPPSAGEAPEPSDAGTLPTLDEPAVSTEEPQSSKDRMARVFGEGVVSQKPLDEVVLEYLVESARKRKRPAK